MLGANAFGWAYLGQAYAGVASSPPVPETPTPEGGFFHTPVQRRQRPERKPQTLVFAVNPAAIVVDAAPAQLRVTLRLEPGRASGRVASEPARLHITLRPEPGRASGLVASESARLDVALVARLAHITRKSEDVLAEMVRDTLCALEI